MICRQPLLPALLAATSQTICEVGYVLITFIFIILYKSLSEITVFWLQIERDCFLVLLYKLEVL